MKSIILTHSMYQDQEVIYPYYRLREEGKVKIVAEQIGKIRGILGTEIESNEMTSSLRYLDHTSYDLLVLPGGVKAMEKLRQDQAATTFVAYWNGVGKPIASMCSGAQMLLSAKVPLKGRRIATYPAMAVDVENAGAIFVNEPVVIDGNIISSPHYKWLAEWMKTTIDLIKGKPLPDEIKMYNFVRYIANRINYADWFSIQGGRGWSIQDQLPCRFDLPLVNKAVSLGYLEVEQTSGSGGYVRYRITRSGLKLVGRMYEGNNI